MSDLGDNIRRIAGVKELKRKIDELQDLITSTADKAGIGKHISNAYGSGASVGSNAVASDDRDTDKGAAAAVGAGGATSANGYTADMKSLFDNQPELGGKIDALGGFVDCDTGDEAKINLNGHYDPEIIPGLTNDGSWTGDTTTNPRHADFVEGTEYTTGGFKGLSPYTSFQAFLDAGIFSETYVITSVTTTVGCYKPNPVSIEGCVNITSAACTAGSSGTCPLASDLPAYTWDSDDIHNIAFDGAQFRSSAQENYDDINNKWFNNSSAMSGCDTDGNEVTLTPDLTGGVKIDYSDGKSVTVGSEGTITAVSGY